MKVKINIWRHVYDVLIQPNNLHIGSKDDTQGMEMKKIKCTVQISILAVATRQTLTYRLNPHGN